jgi:hypothetical protein
MTATDLHPAQQSDRRRQFLGVNEGQKKRWCHCPSGPFSDQAARDSGTAIAYLIPDRANKGPQREASPLGI